MKVFLICVSVASIIILTLLTNDFIVGLKQTKTRNYDMKSVLDRWANAEKQFQKNEKMKCPYSDEELEKEAIENTVRYMNERMEKYNCENTKLETDNYNIGREYAIEMAILQLQNQEKSELSNLKKKMQLLKRKILL